MAMSPDQMPKKKHLKVSNHPRHSGGMPMHGGPYYPSYPSFFGGFPSAPRDTNESVNPEPPESPGEGPEVEP